MVGDTQWKRLIRRRARRILTILVAIYAVVATLYSISVPIYEAPDEPSHINYALFLKNFRTLPEQYSEKLKVPEEGHQPPLYYLLLALGTLKWDFPPPNPMENPKSNWRGGEEKSRFVHGDEEIFPFKGDALAFHALRLFSIPMGACTVILTYAICSKALKREYIAISAAGMNALIPQFTFISGVVNNDNLATLLSSLSLYLLIILQCERSKARYVFLSGFAIGLSLITKMNTGFLLLVAFYVLLAKFLYLKDWDLMMFIRMCCLMMAAILSVAGWFYIRNQLLYGDPIGWKMMLTTAPPRGPGLTGIDYCVALFGSIVYGFFGVFGWLNLPGDYRLLRLLVLIFAVGLGSALASVMRGRKIGLAEREFSMILCLLFSSISIFASVAIVYLMSQDLAHGRLLFPAIGGICTLVALGLDELMKICRMEERARRIAMAFIIIFMLTVNIIFLAKLRSVYLVELKANSKWL